MNYYNIPISYKMSGPQEKSGYGINNTVDQTIASTKRNTETRSGSVT